MRCADGVNCQITTSEVECLGANSRGTIINYQGLEMKVPGKYGEVGLGNSERLQQLDKTGHFLGLVYCQLRVKLHTVCYVIWIGKGTKYPENKYL